MTASGVPPAKPPTQKARKTGGSGDGSQQPVVAPDVEEEEQPVLKRRVDLLRGEISESRIPESYEPTSDWGWNENS